MPINLETGTGYYDGRGIFHPNTGLLPTPIPGYSQAVQINPNLPFDPYGDFQLPAIKPWGGWAVPSPPNLSAPVDAITGTIKQIGSTFSGAANASNFAVTSLGALGAVAAVGLGLLLYKNRRSFA